MKTIFTHLQHSLNSKWKRLSTGLVFFACCCIAPLHAQVSIGAVNPDASAMLDVSATNKGMLIPRLTTAQRNAIASPATGLQIFNLDDKCTDLYDGANWVKNCGLKQVAIGDSSGTNAWVQKANFGGAARSSAVGFSIGTKGYIGTGLDATNMSRKDFWEYNPATDIWSQKADFLGTARNGAVGFGIGTKGYVGTGYDATGYTSNFYEYNPANNMWAMIANFGGTARFRAVAFTIGSKAYVGTGDDGTARKDFWEYDPATGAWTPKADFGGAGRFAAVGFAIGTKGYVGTGYLPAPSKDFWEYDPVANMWIQKLDFGGAARVEATGFSIGNKGYIGTGFVPGPGVQKDFWEYNAVADTWTQKSDVSNIVRVSAVGFSVGEKGYIGTGSSGGKLNDFWQYTPTVLAPVYATPLPSSGYSSISDGAWTINGPTVYSSTVGNVGIGTSSPAAKLDVVGTSRTTNLQVTGGTPGVGKVLSSDASGNATWSGGGVIAQAGLMQGNSGSSIPVVANVNEFFGPTIALTLAANQRVVIVMAAGLGRNAAGNTPFRLDIGYKIGAGPILSASSDGYIVNQPNFSAAAERQTYTMIATFKPGAAGSYQIGCSINCGTAGYLNFNDWATGYYMIINEN